MESIVAFTQDGTKLRYRVPFHAAPAVEKWLEKCPVVIPGTVQNLTWKQWEAEAIRGVQANQTKTSKKP